MLKSISSFINDYRIFPRTFVVVMGYWAWVITRWFMGLADPTEVQGLFATGVLVALVGILKYYVETGKKDG